VELAKLLEDAKFHGIFIADVLGGYDVSLQQWKRRSSGKDEAEL
jgi:alkanesulfonate monooxygenase SsuD/methylene tetrahydromethanopterin reductase-like flavin-dependent oxidoreductase (luciferase family)